MEDDLNIVHSHRKGYSYRSVGITQAVLQSYKLQQELRFAGVESSEDIELSFEICTNFGFHAVLMSVEEPGMGMG